MATGISSLNINETLVFRGGIYSQPAGVTLSFLGDAGGVKTYRAYPGERPIITGSTGLIPTCETGENVVIQYLWFGGTWVKVDPPTVHDFISAGHNVLVEYCTFFGYGGVFIEGAMNLNTFRSNRFVRCGTGQAEHCYYMTNNTMTGLERGRIEKNLMVGGEGFLQAQGAVRYIFQQNFIGDNLYGIWLSGNDLLTVDHNIVWSTKSLRIGLPGTTNSTFDYNIVGQRTYIGDTEGGDHNVFVNNPPSPFGTNQTAWTLADVLSNLGVSDTQLDSACEMLTRAFEGTTAEILANPDINHYFKTLRVASDAWHA